MKLKFRICHLLALAFFAAITAFWISWPRRVALAFVNDPLSFDQLDKIDDLPCWKSGKILANYKELVGPQQLIAERRGPFDILLGRQWFSYGIWHFSVKHARITAGPATFAFPKSEHYVGVSSSPTFSCPTVPGNEPMSTQPKVHSDLHNGG